MINKKNIIWLASYPKSGNTWLRIFLANYLSDSNNPININELNSTPIFSSREIFDQHSPLFSSDLRPNEIDLIRYNIIKEISDTANDFQYFKIHDSIYKISINKFNIPVESTYKAIYLIRNPLDIVVSFANHSTISYKKSAKFICNEKAYFASSSKRFDSQICQYLNSWSGHVNSWSNLNIDKLIIKYEDLIVNPRENFKKITEFLNFTFCEQNFDKSIRYSSFSVLKELEKNSNFRERPIRSESFFRKGKSNDWKNYLNKRLVKYIIESNYEVMKKFEYL